ncbi:MAG TPA: MFS transporter [Acidimicrobiales bacterium]|nr:MFS transporter [Acidimicrobiales bacterium]
MASETGLEPIKAARPPFRHRPRRPALMRDDDQEGSSRAVVFGVCSIGLFMGAIDGTIVATVLHTIDSDLHARINWAGWTITIYQLGAVLAMPLAGKISDQFGRRRVFLYAVALFTVSSLVCGFSNNIYMLVGMRAVQSIGGGAFMPAATGIVADRFGKDRDRALGMFTSIFPLGSILGPIFGGLFVTYWTWRGIFFINVPIGITLFALTLKYIPDSRSTSEHKTDLGGVALLGLVILSAMFGITSLGTAGASWFDPSFVVPEIAAAGLLLLFLRHTNRVAAPFIPMRLLRGKGFAVMNALNFLYGTAALGFAALVPLYAIDRYHVTRLDAGTLLTARGVGMIMVAAIATMMLRKTGYRLPMTTGFLMLAVGMTLMSIAPRLGISVYLWLSVTAGITGLGMGVSAPASNNASLQLAPDQVAAIAGLRGMFRQSGGIFAVSISTALLNRSLDPGMAMAHVFWVLALVLVFIAVPLVYTIPDFKGSW